MRTGPPNALDWPKPMSSIRTMSTLGAPAGAFTSKRGGSVALRASTSVMAGGAGSGIGSTVRSVGNTMRCGAGACATTAVASGPSARARARTNVFIAFASGHAHPDQAREVRTLVGRLRPRVDVAAPLELREWQAPVQMPHVVRILRGVAAQQYLPRQREVPGI